MQIANSRPEELNLPSPRQQRESGAHLSIALCKILAGGWLRSLSPHPSIKMSGWHRGRGGQDRGGGRQGLWGPQQRPWVVPVHGKLWGCVGAAPRSCPRLTAARPPSVSNADPCWPSWRWKFKKWTWVPGSGCSRKCPPSRARWTPPSSSTSSRRPWRSGTSFPRTCAPSSCRPWGTTGRSFSSGDRRPGGRGSQGSCPVPLGLDGTSFLYLRINQGQMLVTFADSHSALSVLDVDGMKVSHAGHPWSGGLFVVFPGSRGHHRRAELGHFGWCLTRVSLLRCLMPSPGYLQNLGERASSRVQFPPGSWVRPRPHLRVGVRWAVCLSRPCVLEPAAQLASTLMIS